MGTTLTGTQINNTYDGLIKVTDNTAITATTKLISDGLGNDTCIKVGTAGTDFLGNVDFSAATVTGLPGGTQSLIADATYTNTMLYNSGITFAGASTVGDYGIGIGGAAVTNCDSITIGNGARSCARCGHSVGRQAITCEGAVAFGNQAQAYGTHSISLGMTSCANANGAIAIGGGATNPSAANACATCSIAIGTLACVAAVGDGSIAIGTNARAASAFQVSIGRNTTNVSSGGVVIGNSAGAGTTGIAIGQLACVQAAGVRGIAIGCNSDSLANEAVAIGCGVQASIAQTVSVRALETQTASTPTAGGIIMNDAGSVARRLNIDASGNLQIDSTPVGGGGGGGTFNFQTSQIPALGAFGTPDTQRIITPLWGYSTAAGYSYDNATQVVFVPFLAKEGETISQFDFDVSTAQAGATMNVGIYKSHVHTDGYLYPEYHATAATGITTSTSGNKSVTGLSITLPTTEDNVYWWAFQTDTIGVRLTIWNNWVSLPFISQNIYRINGLKYNAASASLPTGQITSTNGGTTDAMYTIRWK